ncbi:Uncharacterised protein [Burkholderia pseudomallei]|nr:hypothetical protein AQ15_899 [Burkholderia pseudomallei K96243]CAJ2725431.1 Uncharacterised protein [Burkholderia pseudomallei]CAJ2782212.1 Uncharacterised protein [Burkholderia pseudomallei]CAJ2828669.1 Uncharacterised protein [Burkholderia pseudomallei]CAJ2837449.1 Uncharacterised protein [Burkholderia pseudomallei]
MTAPNINGAVIRSYDGSECRTMRELRKLLSYLVRLDAVFVAGVAAA